MNKILIVVDMQNDFIDGSLGSPEAIDIIPNVVKKIKEFDGHIICTLDTHEENYLETQEGKKLPVTHCIKMSKGWEINKDVFDAIGDKRFTFVTKETFGAKDIESAIDYVADPTSIYEIELIGLCTDICVISNAMLIKAFYPEYIIKVDASCCAGTTPENHKNALNAMKCCQIEVIGE